MVSASGTAGSTKVSASGATGWHAALRQTPLLMSPHAAQRIIFAIAHGCSAHAHASPGAGGPSCAVCRHHASSRPAASAATAALRAASSARFAAATASSAVRFWRLATAPPWRSRR